MSAPLSSNQPPVFQSDTSAITGQGQAKARDADFGLNDSTITLASGVRVNVRIASDSNLSPEQIEKIINKVKDILKDPENMKTIEKAVDASTAHKMPNTCMLFLSADNLMDESSKKLTLKIDDQYGSMSLTHNKTEGSKAEDDPEAKRAIAQNSVRTVSPEPQRRPKRPNPHELNKAAEAAKDERPASPTADAARSADEKIGKIADAPKHDQSSVAPSLAAATEPQRRPKRPNPHENKTAEAAKDDRPASPAADAAKAAEEILGKAADALKQDGGSVATSLAAASEPDVEEAPPPPPPLPLPEDSDKGDDDSKPQLDSRDSSPEPDEKSSLADAGRPATGSVAPPPPVEDDSTEGTPLLPKAGRSDSPAPGDAAPVEPPRIDSKVAAAAKAPESDASKVLNDKVSVIKVKVGELRQDAKGGKLENLVAIKAQLNQLARLLLNTNAENDPSLKNEIKNAKEFLANAQKKLNSDLKSLSDFKPEKMHADLLRGKKIDFNDEQNLNQAIQILTREVALGLATTARSSTEKAQNKERILNARKMIDGLQKNGNLQKFTANNNELSTLIYAVMSDKQREMDTKQASEQSAGGQFFNAEGMTKTFNTFTASLDPNQKETFDSMRSIAQLRASVDETQMKEKHYSEKFTKIKAGNKVYQQWVADNADSGWKVSFFNAVYAIAFYTKQAFSAIFTRGSFTSKTQDASARFEKSLQSDKEDPNRLTTESMLKDDLKTQMEMARNEKDKAVFINKHLNKYEEMRRNTLNFKNQQIYLFAKKRFLLGEDFYVKGKAGDVTNMYEHDVQGKVKEEILAERERIMKEHNITHIPLPASLLDLTDREIKALEPKEGA